MNGIGNRFFDFGYMDTLATHDSPLHRLDPRAKLITSLIFISTVISFDKYAISALIPFFIYPVVQISIGGLPVGYLMRKVLWISPFVILIGIFNPLVDREILFRIGAVQISGGWISFFSIMTRSFLTVTAALVLIAATGFTAVCKALSKLGIPRPFVVQLIFLYRYLFVLTEEVLRMIRAVTLRSFRSGHMGFKTYVPVLGHLLIRTLDRAQRIHLAMFCRAFDGEIRLMRPLKIGTKDLVYVIGWSMVFLGFRFFNVSRFLGDGILGIIR